MYEKMTPPLIYYPPPPGYSVLESTTPRRTPAKAHIMTMSGGDIYSSTRLFINLPPSPSKAFKCGLISTAK